MTTKDKLIKKRLSKTRKIGRMIARLPFVRAVILNGSLASGNHKPSSDIDILIIAKDGRIFSARFFVNIFATIIGVKRSKDDKRGHACKFCFNYFLTKNYLHINYPKERERYCASNYSKSQFVAGDIGLFKKFMKENKSLFVSRGCHPEALAEGSQILRFAQNDRTIIQKFGELFLTSWFEKWAKEYQVKKVESDPRTQQYPNMIVYNDRELRFHPPKAS